jgi:hypothetical protein
VRVRWGIDLMGPFTAEPPLVRPLAALAVEMSDGCGIEPDLFRVETRWQLTVPEQSLGAEPFLLWLALIR